MMKIGVVLLLVIGISSGFLDDLDEDTPGSAQRPEGCRQPRLRKRRVSKDPNVTASEVQEANSIGINTCAFRFQRSFFISCSTETFSGKCRREATYETRFCCCLGFTKSEDRPGCPEVTDPPQIVHDAIALHNNINLGLSAFQEPTRESPSGSVIAYLKAHDHSKFLQLVEKARLTHLLKDTVPRTFFVPPDHSLDGWSDLEAHPGLLAQTILQHIVPGIHRLTWLSTDKDLAPLDNKSVLWVSPQFPWNKIVSVQGVKVINQAQTTGNSVVHVVERPLVGATVDALDILKETQELSTFAGMWAETKLDLTPPYTIFAPTDQAFSDLSEGKLSAIIRDPVCQKNLLSNHVSLQLLYANTTGECQFSSSLQMKSGDWTVFTNAGKHQRLGTVNVTMADFMIREGVLHVVDSVNLPMKALPILQALEESGASEFARLMVKFGIDRELGSTQLYTLFVPSSSALSAIDNRTTYEGMQQLIRFHIVPGLRFRNTMGTGDKLETLATQRYISLSKISSTTAVQGIRLQDDCELEVCKGILYRVDKVLPYNHGTIEMYVTTHANLTQFSAILDEVGLVGLSRSTNRWTLFAPIDQAFLRLSEPIQQENYMNFLYCHALKEALPIGLFSRENVYNMETSCDSSHVLSADRNGWKIDRKVNVLSTAEFENGVVYLIDRVLTRPDQWNSFLWSSFFSW